MGSGMKGKHWEVTICWLGEVGSGERREERREGRETDTERQRGSNMNLCGLKGKKLLITK